MSAEPRMTKGEREELQRLIRQREKVQKSQAKLRSKELLADFENQLGARYSFDDSAVWAKVNAVADKAIAKANEDIAAEAARWGVPQKWAPSLAHAWLSRGENCTSARRVELRKMAQTRIAAIEQDAVVEIEVSSVRAQTEIAIAGLTSEAARAFVDKLPDIKDLMQPLSFEAIAGPPDLPPIVEQLVTPNALRQRRWRERQAAITHNAENNVMDGDNNDTPTATTKEN